MARYVVQSDEAPPRYVVEQPQATAGDRVVTSIPGQFLHGAKQAIDGGAEYLPWALGAVSGGFGLAPNSVSKFFFDESRRVRDMNAGNMADYKASKAAVGMDPNSKTIAEGTGELASGMAIGAALPAMPATAAGRAMYGAATGGATAAVVPNSVRDDNEYARGKGLQTIGAAAAGGIATPAIGVVADKIGPLADRVAIALGKGPKLSDAGIEDRIRYEFAKDGLDFSQIPESIRKNAIRGVRDALKSGEQLDAAEAVHFEFAN